MLSALPVFNLLTLIVFGYVTEPSSMWTIMILLVKGNTSLISEHVDFKLIITIALIIKVNLIKFIFIYSLLNSDLLKDIKKQLVRTS
jgi:hypothetical protein